MQINEEQERIIKRAIQYWESDQLISTATAETLRQSYEVKATKKRFDWKNLSLIAFFFSIACIVLATVLFLVDDWLMKLVSDLLGASALSKCGIFALLAIATFALGVHRRRNHPLQIYSNEALLIFGAIFIAFALTYLSEVLQMQEGNFALFAGFAAIIYGLIAIYLRSQLLWGVTLSALLIWYGLETYYLANESPYFLGMNFPLRYVFFGLLLMLGSLLLRRSTRTKAFFSITYYSGILITLSALWMLSIFGNHGSLSDWGEVPQYQFWYAAILLALASAAAIGWGLKQQDRLTVEIGVIFLLLDIYTRYFEYGWENLHRVVFFVLLAFSFWLIGKKAENLWNLLDKD